MDAKVIRRQKLKWRIRAKISGTTSRPRLSVYRSNKEIYAQLIDDATGVTLAAANSRNKTMATTGTKVEKSKAVGIAIATAALAKELIHAYLIEVVTYIMDVSNLLLMALEKLALNSKLEINLYKEYLNIYNV